MDNGHPHFQNTNGQGPGQGPDQGCRVGLGFLPSLPLRPTTYDDLTSRPHHPFINTRPPSLPLRAPRTGPSFPTFICVQDGKDAQDGRELPRFAALPPHAARRNVPHSQTAPARKSRPGNSPSPRAFHALTHHGRRTFPPKRLQKCVETLDSCPTIPDVRRPPRPSRTLFANNRCPANQTTHTRVVVAHGLSRYVLCRPRYENTPGRSRTCDLRIRSPLLYPTELRVRGGARYCLRQGYHGGRLGGSGVGWAMRRCRDEAMRGPILGSGGNNSLCLA